MIIFARQGINFLVEKKIADNVPFFIGTGCGKGKVWEWGIV
jgi:hypothetical protein